MVRSGAVSLFFLLSFHCLFAQENRYMVFFTDKDNSSYSINNPETFLSDKAITRRTKHNILVDETDLPINENYVLALKNLGVATYHQTKWLNGILVEMLPGLVDDVELLPFVNEVELVAEGTQLLDTELIRVPPLPPITNTPESQEVTEFQNEMVGIPAMHELNFKGEGITVAVLDAGFPSLSRIDAFNHLFENDQVRMTKDYTINQVYIEDANVHGLRVLSILAAERIDFQGIIPNADYLLFITEDTRQNTETPVEEYNWLFAAEAADSAGVDVISSSLGYYIFDEPFQDYVYEDMNGETAVVSVAAKFAFNKGILVVTSAGNTGNATWKFITAPADQPNVLAVGAVNRALDKLGTSAFGPNSIGTIKPDLMAFGEGTATINAEGIIQTGIGTSFAAPLVTGLAIGLIQAMPLKTINEISNAIRASGDRVFRPDNEYGYGIPNFENALNALTQPEPTVDNDILLYPNPALNNHVFVKFDDNNYGLKSEIRLIALDGKLISSTMVIPSNVSDNIQIDLSQNRAGIYLLTVINSNGKFTRKLIKY